MVWNMLREKIGDAQFIKALQEFYRDNRFRVASFDDIRKEFRGGFRCADLRLFFDQGSRMSERRARSSTMRRRERVDITLSQVSPGASSLWTFL
jgi:hypothetical protein